LKNKRIFRQFPDAPQQNDSMTARLSDMHRTDKLSGNRRGLPTQGDGEMTNERHTAQKPSRAGFTLIEIMVVVVILGILATIVVTNMKGKAEEAKKTATKTMITNIKLAIGNYEMDHSKMPESLNDLVKADKHYLDQETAPVDSWGHEFKFYVKGDLVKVQSAGPDGVFDTDDDLINQ
jgi:general secretion pathway protein G